jgi:hypothetical protein
MAPHSLWDYAIRQTQKTVRSGELKIPIYSNQFLITKEMITLDHASRYKNSKHTLSFMFSHTVQDRFFWAGTRSVRGSEWVRYLPFWARFGSRNIMPYGLDRSPQPFHGGEDIPASTPT